MIRVLLVEDEDMFRTGLRLILDAQPDVHVVAEAASGERALDVAGRVDPDVVVMDVRMGAEDGLDATRRLLAAGGTRPPRVIILTNFDLDEYVDRALSTGVAGFVLKSASADELVAAVRTVAAGHAYLAPPVTRRVIEAFARLQLRLVKRPEELDSLSRREREVLVELARGRSNREIAHALGIGETTVRTHVSRVLMKLNQRDRTQAALLARDAGLLETE